jgi:hypothetical protein
LCEIDAAVAFGAVVLEKVAKLSEELQSFSMYHNAIRYSTNLAVTQVVSPHYVRSFWCAMKLRVESEWDARGGG